MAGAQAAASGRRRTLVSHNVNGLASARKRQALFGRIAGLTGAVVALQETHCPDDATAEAWLRQGAGAGRPWSGRGFWCHGSGASRGVALLFTPGFDGADLTVEFTDAEGDGGGGDTGRVLRVGWAEPHAGQRWAAITVYAPTDNQDRARFFSEEGPVARALAAGPGTAHTILVGDFNCILDEEDSTSAAAAAQASLACSNGLRDLTVKAGLVDAWLAASARALAGARRQDRFTYWATNGPTARRLDRAYLTAEAAAAGSLLSCSHWCLGDLPGDHRAVEVVLQVGGAAPPRGAARWRMPMDLLQDAAFLDAARLEARCAQASAGRGWESVASLGPMARWLALKALVADIARVHAARRARDQRAQRAALAWRVRAATEAHAAAAAPGAASGGVQHGSGGGGGGEGN